MNTPTYSDPGPKYFGDVPLKDAMLGWTEKSRFGKAPLVGVPGRVVVILRERSGTDWFKHFGVNNSAGACRSEWREYTKKERLLMLYIEAWHIVARDGIAPEDMHNALMVIPEYRDTLTGETFFS